MVAVELVTVGSKCPSKKYFYKEKLIGNDRKYPYQRPKNVDGFVLSLWVLGHNRTTAGCQLLYVKAVSRLRM